MKCCVCGCNINDYGNNPYPLCAKDDYESRCCNSCNELVIKARIATMTSKKDTIKEGDSLIIFYAKDSEAPIKQLANDGKFLSGIVESIYTSNNRTDYKGSWGNFTVTENDNFISV